MSIRTIATARSNGKVSRPPAQPPDLTRGRLYPMSSEMLLHSHQLRPRPATRSGFTLIEAAIVTAIVGIGIVGLLELIAAGSMANAESTKLTTAVFLANSINEMMQGKDYDTLHATYDEDAYSPPVDGRGVALTGFGTWSQAVDVQYVDPDRITMTVPDSQVEPTSRVTVVVRHNNVPVYTARWIVASAD
ncbi:MAG: hypothetical protein ABIP55_13385 [Tepidisphaeraceae bacterium]